MTIFFSNQYQNYGCAVKNCLQYEEFVMNTDEIKAEKDISMALEEDKEAFRVDCIKEETYDFEDGYREIKKEIKEEVNVQDYENEYEEGYEDIRTEENEKSIEITIKIEKEGNECLLKNVFNL